MRPESNLSSKTIVPGLLPLLILGAALWGCTKEKVTEMVLSIDTDILRTPGDQPQNNRIKYISVEIDDGTKRDVLGEEVSKKYYDVSEASTIVLPATVGILASKGLVTPVLFTVTGYWKLPDDQMDPRDVGPENKLVSRKARIKFVKDKVMVLKAVLYNRCARLTDEVVDGRNIRYYEKCEQQKDMTCNLVDNEAECVKVDVPEKDLNEYSDDTLPKKVDDNPDSMDVPDGGDADADADSDGDGDADAAPDGGKPFDYCRGCLCKDTDNRAGCFVPAAGDTGPGDGGVFEYYIGCKESSCPSNELPYHRVVVVPFDIQLTEVTNGEYAAFLNENAIPADAGAGCEGQPCLNTDAASKIHVKYTGGKWQCDTGMSEYSIYEVSWYGADAFCTWIAGSGYFGQLPTEAEWEFAARGSDHDGTPATEAYYAYPSGNTVAGNQVNFKDNGDPWDVYPGKPDSSNGVTPRLFFVGDNQTLADWGWPDTTTQEYQTLSNASSWSGAYDMAGNLYEWVWDWYASKYCQNGANCSAAAYTDNPQGPADGTTKVIRGGGRGNPVADSRVTARMGLDPASFSNVVGFRCVRVPAK